MSKDRVSGLPRSGPAPESEMSEEMLASRSPFQTALLAAGRADGLTPGRKEKLFRNLSIAVGVPHVFGEGEAFREPEQWAEPPVAGSPQAANVAGHGALKATAKVAGGEALAAKVVGAVAITGALVWGGWQAVVGSSPTQAPMVSQVGAEAPIQEPAAAVAETKPAVAESTVESKGAPTILAEPAPDEAAGSSIKGSRSRAKTADSDSLARELSLIDSARAALLRGEPAVALRTLHSYRSQFPRGALQAEATVQRVEALIATGERASAATIGGAFLKRYPDSPYSRRISSLLGGGREPQVDGARKSK